MARDPKACDEAKYNVKEAFSRGVKVLKKGLRAAPGGRMSSVLPGPQPIDA